MILTAIILVPFIILFGEAIFSSSFHFSSPSPTLRGIGFSAVGMGLYTVMWNFLGWDNTTTYADRVERPARTYIQSTVLAFVLILLVYTLAVQFASVSGIDAKVFQDQGFPALGVLMGGKWLGVA